VSPSTLKSRFSQHCLAWDKNFFKGHFHSQASASLLITLSLIPVLFVCLGDRVSGPGGRELSGEDSREKKKKKITHQVL
jgi:hypothetical protein